jgi:hypothetical protein
MRGFASFVFFIMVSGILLGLAQMQNNDYFSKQTEARKIALHRTSMENAVEKMIKRELQKELESHSNPEEIKNKINRQIIWFLEEYSTEAEKPVTIYHQFGELQTPHYLSLLFSNINEPVSIEKLNENTHVLLLPIEENITYGEYTYTGGSFGTSILWSRIKGINSETIFAIPSGFRICSTNLQNVPCIIN